MDIESTVPRPIVVVRKQTSEDATSTLSRIQWLDSNLHYVYLALMIPIALCLMLVIAPFQQPDGFNHYLRAAQISRGGIIGFVGPEGKAGGNIDANLVSAMAPLMAIPFHADQKLTAQRLSGMQSLHWSRQTTFVDFPNTVIYAPFNYLPSAAGILLGKVAHISIYTTWQLSTLLTAAVSIAITFFALQICRLYKFALFFTMLLPMTLFQVVSISQDSLLFAELALILAMTSRVLLDPEWWSFKKMALMTALITIVTLQRPVYIPLLALLFINNRKLTVTLFDRVISLRMCAIGFSAILVFCVVGWDALMIPLDTNFPLHASVSGQLSFLLGHPTYLLHVARSTIGYYNTGLSLAYIGVLGWGDTYLPGVFINLCYLMFVVGCLVDVVLMRQTAKFVHIVVITVALLTVCLGIFAIQYLTWAPVGYGYVVGIQGRYFLPLFALTPLWLTFLSRYRESMLAAAQHRLVLAAQVTVIAFPLVTLYVVLSALLKRYYIS